MPGNRLGGIVAGVIPGLRPVHRPDQHQPGVFGPGRPRQVEVVDQIPEQRLVTVSKRGQAGRRGGHVSRVNANDHEGVVVSVEDALQMGLARRLEALPRGAPSVYRLFHRADDAVDAFLVDGDEEVLLGGKMIVDRARKHPRRRGNVTNGGAREAVAAEQAGGGIQHVLATAVDTRRSADGLDGHDLPIQSKRLFGLIARTGWIRQCRCAEPGSAPPG